MNARELRILSEIEAAVYEDDEAFADRIAAGPQLSFMPRIGLTVAALLGVMMTLSFSANLALGVAGYLTLVTVGTAIFRTCPPKPAEQSPLEMFHRATAGLFRDTGTLVEADEF